MPARKKEPEDLTAKKELALEVIDRLKKEYPASNFASLALPDFRNSNTGLFRPCPLEYSEKSSSCRKSRGSEKLC